jgi:hypothetical protein
MVQQYRGSAVDIIYTPESLREIFVNNVPWSERPHGPVRAVRSQPARAFLAASVPMSTRARKTPSSTSAATPCFGPAT